MIRNKKIILKITIPIIAVLIGIIVLIISRSEACRPVVIEYSYEYFIDGVVTDENGENYITIWKDCKIPFKPIVNKIDNEGNIVEEDVIGYFEIGSYRNDGTKFEDILYWKDDILYCKEYPGENSKIVIHSRTEEDVPDFVVNIKYTEELVDFNEITYNSLITEINNDVILDFNIQPKDIEVEPYVSYSLSYIDDSTIIPTTSYDKFVKVDFNKNIMSLKLLGVGKLKIDITIKYKDVTRVESFEVESYFEDDLINQTILSNSGNSYVSLGDLALIQTLILNFPNNEVETVDEDGPSELTKEELSISFKGTETLTSLKTIIYNCDSFVNITSSYLPNCDYRVKITEKADDELLLQYLNSEVFSNVKNKIIPFMESYNDKFVVYHHYEDTDNNNKFKPNIDVYGSYVYCEKLTSDSKFISHQAETTYKVYGYNFDSWLSDAGIEIDINKVMSTKNGMHLYATWEALTIQLELIDHINNNRSYAVTFDSAFGEITYQPQINGFTFVGWYLDDESSEFKYNDDKLILKDSVSNLTKNYKAYAKFTTTISANTYGNAETFEIDNIIYGEKIGERLKNPVGIVDSRWLFNGWYDTKFGSGDNAEQLSKDTIFIGQGSIVNNKFEIYAKWTKNVNLSFYNDSKYNNPLNWNNSVNVTYGVSLSDIDSLIPEKFMMGDDNAELQNWNFEGWHQDVEFTKSFNNNTVIESFSFTDTLYAKFTTNYSLGLYKDVNDYTHDLKISKNTFEKCVPTFEEKVVFGQSVDVKNHKKLVGCEFIDWTLNQEVINHSVKFDNFDLGDITLYPTFKVIDYKIYYGYRENNSYITVDYVNTFNVFDLRFEDITAGDLEKKELINKIESLINPGKEVIGFNYYIDDDFIVSNLRNDEEIDRNYVNIYADAVTGNRTFNVIYYNYSFEENRWMPIDVEEQYSKVKFTEKFTISPAIELEGWGSNNGWYNNNGNFGIEDQSINHTNTLYFDESYCTKYGYHDVHLYPKYDIDIIFNSVILGNSGSSVSETINVTFGTKVNIPLQKIKDNCSNSTQNSNPWEFLYWTKEICSDFANLEKFDDINFECFKNGTTTFDFENDNKGYLNLYAVWAKKFILEYYQNEFKYKNEIINEVQLYYSYTKSIVDILENIELANSDWNIVSWYNGAAKSISLLENDNHLILQNSDSNVIKAIFEKKINIFTDSALVIGYDNEIQASRNKLLNENVKDYKVNIDKHEFIVRLDSNFNQIVDLDNISLEKYLESNNNFLDHFALEGLYSKCNDKYYKFNGINFSSDYNVTIDFKDITEFKLVFKAIPYNITYYEEEGINSKPYNESKYSIIDPIKEPICPEKENYAFYTEKWVYYDAETNEILENQDIKDVQKTFKDIYAIATYEPVSYKVYIMNNNNNELHAYLGLDEVLSYSYKEKYVYTENGLTGFDYFKKIFKDAGVELSDEQEKALFYEQLYISGKTFEWKCYDYISNKEVSLEETGEYEGDLVFKPTYKLINYNITFVDGFDQNDEKPILIDGNNTWTYNVENGYSSRIPSGSEVSKEHYTYKWTIFWNNKEYLLDNNNKLTDDFINECFMKNNVSLYNGEIITVKAIYTPVEYYIKYVNEFYNETDESIDGLFDKLIGIIEYNVTTISQIEPLTVPFKVRDTGMVDDGSWFSGVWQYFNENGEEVFIDENLHGNIIAKPVYTANTYTATFKFVDSVLNKTAELGSKEFTMPSRFEFNGDDVLVQNKEEYAVLGYDLIGWLDYELVAENMSIYVDYEYIEYTVSYLYEDGITKVQYLDLSTGQTTDYTSTHTILQYSSDLSYPDLPYKEGYTIKWRCLVDGVEVSSTSRLAPCEVTCMVSYELIPYQVTFRTNDDIYYVSVYYINDQKKVTPYNEPELSGYVFDGWYIDNKEFNISWNDYELTSGNVNVIAKFIPITYTITYQFEDEITKVIEYSKDGLNGNTVPLVPDKAGMTGIWKYYDEEDNIVSTIEGGDLIAKLEYSLNSYEIKYKINEKVVKSLLYSINTDMSKLDVPTLENELTWIYYNELGEEITLINGLTSNLIGRPSNEDAIYYVTYYSNDSKTNVVTTLQFGQTAPKVYKKGYEEEVIWKYYSVIDDSLVIDNPTSNLYAIPEFTPVTYTITFLNQYKEEIKDLDNNNVISTYNVENLDITYPEIINRENEGYKYSIDLYNQEMEKITLNNNTCADIYAVVYYDLIEYTVIFEDENSNILSVSKYTLDNKDISSIEPFKQGYEFVGWIYYHESDLETPIEFNEDTVGNLVSKPSFELINFTVQFVNEDGTVIKEVTYNVENMNVEKPEVPEKLGYLGNWMSYDLTFEDIIVRPNYYQKIKYSIYYYSKFENGLPSGDPDIDEYDIESISQLNQHSLNDTIIEWAFHINENDEYIEINDPIEAIKKNTIIYACPKIALEHKINYYSDNDFSKKEIAVITTSSGELLNNINEPSAPFISGKQFVKWVYVLDNEEIVDNTYTIGADLCAYPIYENIVYNVTYYDQHNKVLLDTNVTFTIDSTVLENIPEVPQPIAGYENGVWVYYYVSNNSEVDVTDLSSVKNENLYAKPKYQLSNYIIHFYDEKGMELSQQVFTIKTDINSIIPPIVESKNGYNVNWNLPELIATDLHVQVEYTLIDYTISYYDTHGNLVDILIYNINDSTISSLAVPNVEYYEGYWNYYRCDNFSDANSSNEVASVTTGNLIAKPVYKPIVYTICFNDEFGNVYYELDYTILDNDIVLPNTEVIGKDGYSCVWNYNGLTYKDMVVTPIYTPIAYTVDFVRDGLSIKKVTYTVEDKSFDIPLLQSKVGYTYNWYYNELVFEKALLTTGNIEVVEKENIITYTISFVDENNNNIATRNYTVEDKSFNLPISIPQKQYCDVHWELNGEIFDELSKSELLENKSEDLVINLVYEQIKYNIRFKDDNGNIINTLDKEYYYTVNENNEVALFVKQGELIESISSSNTPQIPEISTYWNRTWLFEISDLGVDYIATIKNSNPRSFTIYFYNSKSDFDNNIILTTDEFNIEDKVFSLPDENKVWIFFKEGNKETPIKIDDFYKNKDEIYNLYAYPETIISEYSYTIKYYDINNKLIYIQKVVGEELLDNVEKLSIPSVIGLENGKWNFTYEGDGLPANGAVVIAVPEYSNILYSVTYYTIEDTVMETSNYVIYGENAYLISNVPTITDKIGYTSRWVYTLNDEIIAVNNGLIKELNNPGNIEAKIAYTPISYSITFNLNDEIISEANYSILNPSFFKPVIPAKDGYDRVWKYYDEETNNEIVVDNDLLPDGTYGNIVAKVFDTPIQYTIKYLDNFGKLIKTITYNIENNIISDYPENTNVLGYLTEWKYYDAENSNSEVSEITFGNLIAKELSTPIDYKVLFVDENNNTIYETTFNVENKKVINPAVPEKVGYTANWEEVNFNYDNLLVKPVYTPIKYTIVYHIGSKTEILEYTICDKSEIVEPSLPNEGDKQGVWAYYDKDNNPVILTTDTYGDLYAYADYSYNESENYVITFVDEFGTVLYTKLLPINLSINELVLPDVPTKFGYAEKQWNLPNTEIVSDTIIYPIYSDPINYKVTLYDKENEFADSFIYNIETIDDVIYLFKTYNISVPGYIQLDWTYYNENDLSQIVNINEIGKSFFGNVIAKYNDTPITYTIIFDQNTGEGEMETLNCIYDQPIKLPKSLFTKVGYHQIGWLINDVHYDLESEITDNLSTQNGDSVYCKAKWKANTYVLRFITNTLESSYNDAIIQYDEDIELPSPVKTGYKDGKWVYNGANYEFGKPYSNFTTEYNEAEDKPVVVLEAVWTPITYQIITICGQVIDCTYDMKSQLPTTYHIKSGYKNDGKWYISINGSVSSFAFGSDIINLTDIDGSILYASLNYTPITYTVIYRYKSNGEPVSESKKYTYDTDYYTLGAKHDDDIKLYFKCWKVYNGSFAGKTHNASEKVKNYTTQENDIIYIDAVYMAYYIFEVKDTDDGGSIKFLDESGQYIDSNNNLKNINNYTLDSGQIKLLTGVKYHFSVSYANKDDREWTLSDFDESEIGNDDIGNWFMRWGSSQKEGVTDCYIKIKSNKQCIVKGSLITLADGTYKKVEDLLPTDQILVFNHMTGKLESSSIIFNYHGAESLYRILCLEFSDGTIIKEIDIHGYFDLDLNKYIFIDELNVEDYLGHSFYKYSNGVSEIVKLSNYYVIEEVTESYSPMTKEHLNCFVNDILSVTAGIEGFINIFDLDENMKVIEEKYYQDIDKYGLYDYNDFADLVPEFAFDAFPTKYLKISIGKGHMTYDDVIAIIDRYMEQIKGFNK